MEKELAKAYEPREVEGRIYDFWLKGGWFHAEADPKKTPYTIMMPPPNVTDQLHVGHAMTMTTQDVLIRWKRMQGYSALWLPGTDHAALATEVKIVESLAKEGLTKEGMGREKYMERAWQWNEKYGGRITEQLKLLGSSADWDRQRFTLDEGCSRAVRHVFVKLYEKGLIYRGERLINWCPHCKTALSDAEVEFEEKEGAFWHLRYPLADGSGYIQLATTRPETMLGDTAVAVHPEDGRYKHLIGKNVILPLVNKEIPIVADEYVEMDFGTGVVKITPAHDPNDFEVGKRHGLPVINIMNEDGSINENGGKYAGLPGLEARKRIVEDLEAAGCLVKVEPMKHNVGVCHRCHTVVEPWISTQWFVKMESMAKPAIEAVREEYAGEKDQDHPRAHGEGLLQLDGEHQGLVHLPADLVGAPDSRLVLRWLRRDRCQRGRAPNVPPLRRGPSPGRGHAGHLVLFGPVALLHLGLARGYGRPAVFLSH